MKYLKVLFLIFIFPLSIVGQDFRLLNTKDLVDISAQHGLDSALKLTGTFPLYYIDEATTKELIKQIENNKPTYRIETFLADYALCVQPADIANILYDYFNRKKDELVDYIPVTNHYNISLYISQNSLFALIENPLDNTDSLLFEYYELWKAKADIYLQAYQQGLEETDKQKQEILITPYEHCNYNCYILQRFLKQMESPLYDQEKLEEHQILVSGRAIRKNVEYQRYNNNKIFKTITLSKNYNSIGNINFKKELKWKKMIPNYKPYCDIFLMFNDKVGYLDLGCYYNEFVIYGSSYRLELQGNKLIVYKMSSWVS
jgi:hypothetical protein